MPSNTRAPIMGLLGALLVLGLSQATAWASSTNGSTGPCPPTSSGTHSSTAATSTTTTTEPTSTTIAKETRPDRSTTTTEAEPGGQTGSAGNDKVVRNSPLRYLDASGTGKGCTPPGRLPFTGANTLPLLGASLFLIAAGSASVRIARRRGSAESR